MANGRNGGTHIGHIVVVVAGSIIGFAIATHMCHKKMEHMHHMMRMRMGGRGGGHPGMGGGGHPGMHHMMRRHHCR